jgi:hypothetical protein
MMVHFQNMRLNNEHFLIDSPKINITYLVDCHIVKVGGHQA